MPRINPITPARAKPIPINLNVDSSALASVNKSAEYRNCHSIVPKRVRKDVLNTDFFTSASL
jgi:hypothetical protein